MMLRLRVTVLSSGAHDICRPLIKNQDLFCWESLHPYDDAMSIMEYNGSAVIAMCGKNCVALASDTRFGAQHQTIATDFQRIFRVNDKCFVGLSGLASDVQTVMDRINFRMNLYKLREDRDIAVGTFNNFLSSFLYERRFGPWFVEPLVAGLEGPENKPFIAGQDLLGAAVHVYL